MTVKFVALNVLTPSTETKMGLEPFVAPAGTCAWIVVPLASVTPALASVTPLNFTTSVFPRNPLPLMMTKSGSVDDPNTGENEEIAGAAEATCAKNSAKRNPSSLRKRHLCG